MTKRLAIAIVICLTCMSLQARRVSFRHIGAAEGLSHSTVVSIVQDLEGKMWFATHDGLNCYDGYDITIHWRMTAEQFLGKKTEASA